jgi:Trp operon repressor
LLKAHDREDLSDLLEDILTPSEIVEIWDRITVIKMLKEGIAQREIAQKLGISITTVSRWSRLLNFERKTIQNYV